MADNGAAYMDTPRTGIRVHHGQPNVIKGHSGRDSMDVSVIIPSRGERLGLWATVASVRSDLEASGLSFEIRPVINGDIPDIAALMHDAGICDSIFAGGHIDSPQSARDLGVQLSTGETLFFLDAHVIIPSGFFRTVLNDMEVTGADLMHTPHRYLSRIIYGSRVAWDDYLWTAESIRQPPEPGKPFKVALSGHGAIAIRRESYERAGGYWQALKGFGGEETQLDFKLWLMGMSCWMSASTYHWHWLPQCERHTPEMFKDRNFVRNFLMIAGAYGGPEQVRRSWEGFKVLHWQNEPLHEDLLDIFRSPESEMERARIQVHGKYRDLAELRMMFSREGVIS